MTVTSSLQSWIVPTSFGECVVLLWGIWVLWYVVSTIVAYRRLRHIPGPFLAGLTSLWWIAGSTSERQHLVLAYVCNRYGSIARLTPNTVVTDDVDLYRKINSTKDHTYTRSTWYKAFRLDARRNNLLSEIDDEKHTFMRHRLAPGYSGKDNPALESTIDEVVLTLVQTISRKYISVKSDLKAVDLAQLAQYFTLDVITYLSLGEPFGFIADDEDKYNYVGSFDANWPIMNLFSNVPLLANITQIPLIQKLLLPKVTDREGLGKAKAVAREIIAKRFNDGPVERHDMVLSFKKHGLSEDEIADESLLQLLAGSDTVATTLRTGFFSIVSNPQIYNKLRNEIDTLCNDISLSLDQVVPLRSATKLPYLQACIKEALRHNPPGTGLLPRVVGPVGDTHKGVYLPPGTEVGICSWNIHRNNTAVYGADAAVFRPERWLEASPDQLAKMEDSSSLVFSYGRFRCLGENIAKIDLNKALFELLRRFDWSLTDPLRPFTRNSNYGLFVQKGLWMRVEKRQE